jgi:hypothetical protein
METIQELTARLFQRHLTLAEGNPLPVTRSEFDRMTVDDPRKPETYPYLFGRLVFVFLDEPRPYTGRYSRFRTSSDAKKRAVKPIKFRPYSVAQTRQQYDRKVSVWTVKLWAETLPQDELKQVTYKMWHYPS